VRQFDIIENINPITRRRYPFSIVLQHDSVSVVATVIVAPVAQVQSGLSATRLHPPIVIEGRQYLIITEELAAVHRRTIGRVIGSAEAARYSIIAAIDICFTGV
jgi:hypothetical protein